MFRKRIKSAVTGSIKPAFMGAIDRLYPSDMAGWAADASGRPAPVTVLRNGERVASLVANQVREDLGRAGIAPESAFVFNFPDPLSPDDRVEVRFPDGSAVPGADRPAYPERLRRLLTGIDVDRMTGLELGALDRPVISKKRHQVRYVDHAPTAELRLKYAHTPRALVDVERIVDVDVVWASGRLADALPAGQTVDYCIACHVFEHVADPIGWLRGLAEVLRPGGLVSLAIPEKTRTFDHLRAVSGPADLIEAYLLRPTRPTPRQVFDCVAFHAPLGSGNDPSAPPDQDQLRHALHAAEIAATSEAYLDMHCTVWTLEAFRRSWDVIRRLELVPLDLLHAFEPQDGADDFIVILRKT